MTQRVLFFSCEPGGAEVLIPVVRQLRAAHWDVIVAAYGYAEERFRKKGIEYVGVPAVGRDDASLLETFRPDIIITSAASHPAKDMSEKYLWAHARRLGPIPTVAMLDQWQNYALRFSGPDAGDRLAYLPDHINCINEIGRREMIAEGFPAERLHCFGHPSLSQSARMSRLVDVQEVRTRLGIGLERGVDLFVSEAIFEYFGQSRGYDQYGVLAEFLESRTDPNRTIVVKLHPKDDVSMFAQLRDQYRHLDVIFIQHECASFECIAAADRVVGMTSIMLIEAYLAGKPVVSLQPGLRIADPLVLTRWGYLGGTAAQAAPGSQTGARFECEFQPVRFLSFINSLIGRETGVHET